MEWRRHRRSGCGTWHIHWRGCRIPELGRRDRRGRWFWWHRNAELYDGQHEQRIHLGSGWRGGRDHEFRRGRRLRLRRGRKRVRPRGWRGGLPCCCRAPRGCGDVQHGRGQCWRCWNLRLHQRHFRWERCRLTPFCGANLCVLVRLEWCWWRRRPECWRPLRSRNKRDCSREHWIADPCRLQLCRLEYCR